MSEPARLVFRLNGQVQRVELVPPAMKIGREASCDIPVPDPAVSREHAEVRFDGSSWSIADLRSRNGIFVNEERVESCELSDGDRVHLGGMELVFSTSARHDEFESSSESLVSQINVVDFQASLIPRTSIGAKRELTAEDSAVAANWALPLFSRAAQTLVSTRDLRDMLETVIALVFEHLPAERACVVLYEEGTTREMLRVGRTKAGKPEDSFTISRNIVRNTLEQRSAVLVADAMSDENLALQKSIIMNQIRSAMCAPLYNDEKVESAQVPGIIYADTASGQRPFSHRHLEVLTTLALLSAAAVQKEQLRDRMRKEQEIRGRLERYSAPTVVERIIQNDQDRFTDEVDASILFLDFVKFTALAEKLPTVEVLEILNTVLEGMTECVFEYEGTLDKFTGDGLMAIFGAPLPQPDHALRAVRTAVAMQAALGRLNETMREPLQMRVGINSGVVIAGDVGPPRRKDYTVIGDVVNTASRLESQVAKPGQIVVGERTYEQVKDHFVCEELGPVTVKGKQQAFKAFVVRQAR